MTTYLVRLIIGTEYFLKVEADTAQQVHDRVNNYDPTGIDNDHIVQLENETGRATLQIDEYTLPACPVCEESETDCRTNSVETGEIVRTFKQLHDHYTKLNDDTAHQLSIVLDGYLTHCVSTCNVHSRG